MLFQSLSHSSSRSTLLALFLFSNHFNNVTKVQFQIGAWRVALEGEQKLACVPMQDGGSLMSVFTLKENRRHKVTQKVAHNHKQNTLRCHLHTLVCTLSQMYNVHKKHNSTMKRQQIDEPRVSHRVALPSPLCKVFHPASAFPAGKSSKYSTPTYTCSHGTC